MTEPEKYPDELGVIWLKTNKKTGKTLWSGTLRGVEVVGFTFKTHNGREGMSLQVSRTHPRESKMT